MPKHAIEAPARQTLFPDKAATAVNEATAEEATTRGACGAVSSSSVSALEPRASNRSPSAARLTTGPSG